jgi:hypothetical protein
MALLMMGPSDAGWLLFSADIRLIQGPCQMLYFTGEVDQWHKRCSLMALNVPIEREAVACR